MLAVGRDGRITARLGGAESGTGLAAVGTHVFEHCHPDDLSDLRALARSALASGPGWQGSARARVRAGRGSWQLHDLHVVDRSDDPAIGGFVVHVRRTAEAARVDEVGGELAALADVVPLPIAVVDGDGTARLSNRAARDLVRHLDGRFESDGLVGLADLRDRHLVEDALAWVREHGGEVTTTFRLLPVRPSAAERVVEATLAARDGADELRGPGGIVVTLVDVSAYHARESELRRMATCDPLTGLLNRVEFEGCLADRLARSPERVALLFCDLDGFKAVNDTHGHGVGDELLVDIAQLLESRTRPGDLVGRLGGDEFAVLVDGASAPDSDALACRIAVSIAELSAYRRLPVSASVGAATARRGDTPRDLLRRADAAMYDEKRRRHTRARAIH